MHINVPLTPKDQTFKLKPSLLMRTKHLMVRREEDKHTNHALDSEDRTFKPKIRIFKSKINLSRQ